MDPSVNYFYTSCTRSDGWPAISRFHADLEYRLRAQEGLWVSGALGPQAAPGQRLAGAVAEIAEVGVMIALCSPQYFQSQYCGMEWAVFETRISRHRVLTQKDASTCLIPILWEPVPPDAMPPPTGDGRRSPAEIQWEDGFGGNGLHQLMQSDSREAEDAYFALLERLSRRIAEARRIRLSTLDADELPRVRSAFGRLPLTRQTTSPRTPVYTGSYTAPGGGYGSRAPSPPVSIAISYVGADQPWADWMAEVLERDGHPSVTQVRWETERESLSETVDRAHRVAERVIALFSRTYFTAGETEPLDWEGAFVGADRQWLIPVQIDAEPRPLLVRRGVPVTQLKGSDETEAQRLCELVRDPNPRIPGQREGDTR
ncbi:toll/interleukin-1 receptor domain-containing protein [Streptomyces umbrinus]|uniref:toll/interleukin-1 receptor domain-containing protein n=1 Tax=Streptomyces umbrinus TaxID=67370 RepID=UPI0033E79684